MSSRVQGCLHALRLGPAAKLMIHPIDPEKIRAHLDHSRRATTAEEPAGDLLRRAS